MINRNQLLDYVMKEDLINYNWYREMFSIPLSKTNEYFSYDIDSKVVTLNDGTKIKLDSKRETPLLLSDRVELEVNDLDSVTKNDSYSIGDIILNYLLVTRPLGKSIPFTIMLRGSIVEDYIANYLGTSVTTDQYNAFVECCGLVEQMSELFVVSSTDASMSPAPGIRDYKKKLFKEYRELHGEKFDTDIRLIVEIEKKLEAYDREYLKDDPTYGVLVNDKIVGNARKNLYGTIGAEMGMDGKITPVIENSLLEGYPTDNAQLAAVYNSSRKGSIMRGHMTQFTGADAKMTSRVLNTITVVPNDCKTTNTLTVRLTESNYNEYLHYNIMVSGTVVALTIDNIKNYLGKDINLRTYLMCIEGNDKYCSVCSGRQGLDNSKIAIILSTENSAIFTNTSMKAMHDKSLKLVDYNLEVALY